MSFMFMIMQGAVVWSCWSYITYPCVAIQLSWHPVQLPCEGSFYSPHTNQSMPIQEWRLRLPMVTLQTYALVVDMSK